MSSQNCPLYPNSLIKSDDPHLCLVKGESDIQDSKDSVFSNGRPIQPSRSKTWILEGPITHDWGMDRRKLVSEQLI